MFDKPALSNYPLEDTISRRWSGRAYDPDRPVERRTLGSLLEAARWAPSCFGDQPWTYLIWDRANDQTGWEAALGCMAEGNQTWAGHAPVLMLATARETFRTKGEPNRWAQYDTGAASVSLALQATALGLMVHQMGGFDPEAAREAFAIPDDVECMAMIAVGYQLAEKDIPEDIREREYGERGRLPLSDVMFEGRWGKPVKL